MTTSRAKSAAESAAITAIQDYLKGDDFLSAIKSAVQEAIDKHMNTFIERLDKLESDICNVNERLEQNEGKILEADTSSQAMKKEIKSLSSLIVKQSNTIENLKVSMNEADQYSRRNCLKFYGVKENPGEDTDNVILQIANEQLEVPLAKTDIDRSHRIASPRHSLEERVTDGTNKPSNSRPKPIIVKFTSYRVRSSVIRARRKLKGTGMGIDEALTATNQSLLSAAKKHEKVRDAWTADGRVIILLAATGNKTVKRLIRSGEELKRL